MEILVEDRRLDRIEEKIDELTKVVTELARIEERMITLFRRMDRYDLEHAALAVRLTAIEQVTISRGVIHYALDKGFWLVVGAVTAAGISWLSRNGGPS